MLLNSRDLIAGALSLGLNLLLWLYLSPLVGPHSPNAPTLPPVRIVLLPPPAIPPTALPPSPSPKPKTSPSPSERKSRPSLPLASRRRQPTPHKTPDATAPSPLLPPASLQASEQPSPSASNSDEGKEAAPPTSPPTGVESADGGEPASAKEEESPPSEADLGRWLALVKDRIARSVRYPSSARRAGLEGTVTLTLTISPSGELVSLSVHAPEGLAQLARAAEEAARRATPFPPPPSGQGIEVEVPVVFRLSAGE